MMSKRKIILVLATLSVASVSPVTYADLYHDFVFVPFDSDIAKGTSTREEYNKSHPKAAKRWRDAWAAEGTKNDNQGYAGIRKNSTRPADMKPTIGDSPSTTVKNN